jgi:glyoxylase-like metal-dependent hydrolase (beta-lactamase superfamily II)
MPQGQTTTTRRDMLKLAAGAASVAALGAAGLPTAAHASAPMLGVLRPTIYRFKLGNFEITNILDGTLAQASLHPAFGSNQTAETVQALAAANNLTLRSENPYVPTLVNTGKELILFDSGNPKGRSPTTGHLPGLLVTAGYKPEQIDIVVITHGHIDHIGGLMTDGKPTYPNARIVFGEVDFDAWRKGNVPDNRKPNVELYNQVAVPFAEKATFLKPEGEVATGIRAVNAFGHSPGMLAFHVESNNQRLLIWGDVANHYVVSIQQPEWHFAGDDMRDEAIATRKRILDMVSTDKIPVAGFHMPFPSIGFVEKVGAGYRWMPASYQFSL